MNYLKLHNNAVNYFKTTDPKDRLRKRNPNDLRLNDESIYVEIHHIIPRSLGGLDDLTNLVEVLPEEHIFIHMLRYRIYRKREDMLAVRFMLNGFDNKNIFKGDFKVTLTKKLRMGYAWLRSHAQGLRAEEGWHTPEGRENISKARKGKMPVKNAKTGELLRKMVPVDHPKVLLGEWVHHSKGRVQSQKEVEQKRAAFRGQNNPNASGLTEEYFIKKGLEAFDEFGYILSWPSMLKLSQTRNFKWIKSLRSRFGGRGILGYLEIMENKTGSKYDPNANQRKIFKK